MAVENPITFVVVGFSRNCAAVHSLSTELSTAATAAAKTLQLAGVLNRLVDKGIVWTYNNTMMNTTTPRKKRADRNHIIYELRVQGGNYIGVTAKTESTINKSVLARAAKHFYRAKTETKNWLLCAALRELNSKDEIEVLVHEVIRGKAAAHKREVELRRQLKPTLNTDVRGD